MARHHNGLLLDLLLVGTGVDASVIFAFFKPAIYVAVVVVVYWVASFSCTFLFAGS